MFLFIKTFLMKFMNTQMKQIYHAFDAFIMLDLMVIFIRSDFFSCFHSKIEKKIFQKNYSKKSAKRKFMREISLCDSKT